MGLLGAICTNCLTIKVASRFNSSLCLSLVEWSDCWKIRNNRAYIRKLFMQIKIYKRFTDFRITWNSITGILQPTAMRCRIATVDFSCLVGICFQSDNTVVHARTTLGFTNLKWFFNKHKLVRLMEIIFWINGLLQKFAKYSGGTEIIQTIKHQRNDENL